MDGFLLDTSVLSVYLDSSHKNHINICQSVDSLDPEAPRYVSAVSLAEVTFGAHLAEAFGMGNLPNLLAIVQQAQAYGVLDITKHTAAAYAELKANLAKKYLAKAGRRDRPPYLVDWVDKITDQKLQVGENDLWMCAQSKERDLILVVADRRIQRIADADPEVRLLIF